MSSALPDDGFAAPDADLQQGSDHPSGNTRQGKNKKKGRGCLYAILVVIVLSLLGRFACERAVNYFIADDPGDVAEQAGRLADYKLPVGFSGKLSVRVPKIGQFSAFSRDDEGRDLAILVLAGLDVRMNDEDLINKLDSLAWQNGSHKQQSSKSDIDPPQKCKLAEFDAMCLSARSRSQPDSDQVAMIWQVVIVQQADKTFIAAMGDSPDNFDKSKWQRFMQNLKPNFP